MRSRSWLAVSFALGCLLASPAAAQVVDPGVVVETLDTSAFSPVAPSPTGIAYLPGTDELLICDSEVDEDIGGVTLYAGVNLWTHSRSGEVSATATTLAFSNEPSGIAVDPAGGRLWISDDNAARIYQVDLGADGAYGTADDFVGDLDGLVPAGCDDLKDVTYDADGERLFAVSRAGLEVCEIQPGANLVFDGAAPTGDDVVTTWSLIGTGITAPEGIFFDPESQAGGSLVIADKGTRNLYEFDPAGSLLRIIDVAFPADVRPSGVTIAPGTTNPVLRNYYVTDRGLDNNVDPLENDGRIFEVAAVPLLGNSAPSVDAGAPQAIVWPENQVNLDATLSDDGHPFPPSAVTATWSLAAGPGDVSFGDASSPDTTATFSAPGSYELALLGHDGELSASDTVTIEIAPTFALDVSTGGAGAVLLDPPGGFYEPGTTVTLTAAPEAGFYLGGWSGALSGTANPETLVMDADYAVHAEFKSAGAPGTSCGIGPELAALLPTLGWLLARRRAVRR